jgi:hypothetical protein
MSLLLDVVGLAVLACDPLLWVATIIAAFFSRGRWWIVPLVGMAWAAVLDLVLTQMLGTDEGRMFYRALAGLLNGLVVAGIAEIIRKLRGLARQPAARPGGPVAPQ